MGKKKRLIVFILVFTLTITSVIYFPILSEAKSKYYNYSPDKKGKTTATVNMRSGASTSKKKLKTIPNGKSVPVYGYMEVPGKNWYKVKYGGKIGYVRRDYVKITSSSTKTQAKSSITGSGIKYPTTLTQGKGFVVKGTVKSKYKLSYVKAGIMKISTGKFYTSYTGTAKPNATSYNLSKLDAKIPFTKAKPGTYYYSVWAKDIKGKSVYLLKKKFTVKAKSSGSQTTSKYHGYSPSKKGITNEGVRMRKSSSTTSAIITTVPKNKSVTVYGYDEVPGLNWYKVKYSGESGYIRRDYVDIVSSNNVSDIKEFPVSYQPLLKELQEEHPSWKFIPQRTGISWNTLIENEMRTVSRQLVEPTSPDSWKSKEPGAYDKKTGKYVSFDGRWNAASEAIVKYYLDPRNFLNDSSIYQFMDHGFNSVWQNKKTIASGVANPNGSFLATESYYEWLYNSGKKSGVNPNVIASMLIMEQGWKGTSSLISGTYKGYKGYYNYFNIGAYTTSDMSSVERGLWYAKGQNQGFTSWNRPWNTREKSITGGAQFYKAQYMDNGQDTFYTKKFNVVNGASNAGTHEYCTNVTAADGEGKILRRGFVDNSNLQLEFKIPVYENMPSGLCKKPN